MEQAAVMTMGLRVSDMSGHKSVRAPAVPADYTVGELVQSLIANMGLTSNDSEGRPLQYQARLEREGRHLRGAEVVGEALREDDAIVLTPDISAG